MFIIHDIILCQDQDNKRLLLNYRDLHAQYKQLINSGYISADILNAINKTMYIDRWIRVFKNEKEYLDVTYCKSEESLKSFCNTEEFELLRCSKDVLGKIINGCTVEELIKSGGGKSG